MELIGGPAALGGIILCVALCGWSFGRWQGATPPVAARPDAGGGAATQKDGGARPVRVRGRTEADDMVASLGNLHAEISAYRRAEQVLFHVSGEGSEDVVSLVAAAARDRATCIDQPSVPVAPSLTRV